MQGHVLLAPPGCNGFLATVIGGKVATKSLVFEELMV